MRWRLEERVAVPAVALVFVVSAASAARADVRVIFSSQHTMRVEAVRFEDGRAVLDLGDGNEMQVPASAIAEVRTLPGPARDGESPGERSDWKLPAGHEAAGGALEDAIARAALETGLEPALLAAVVEVESGFDPFAVSPKGAAGLMQLMPGTARELSLDDPFDAAANIAAGARWLRRLIDRYQGDLDLALAAYNAGEGAVERFGGIPPFPETRRYVRLVRESYRRLARDSDA